MSKTNRRKSDAPVCSNCGATGAGAQFKMFSKFGFGTYCVPCENELDPTPRALAESLRIRRLALGAQFTAPTDLVARVDRADEMERELAPRG